jgi:tRNA A37 threonylcarbamoyladenosine synthetase subunit TsaC/SUA5/YrdC
MAAKKPKKAVKRLKKVKKLEANKPLGTVKAGWN